MADAGIVQVSGKHDAGYYAEQIARAWQKSVESIFEVGRYLIEAKNDLDYGEFGQMVENSLPFGWNAAQGLMKIHRRLSNAEHVQHLPPSWGTLKEIAKLDDEQFAAAIGEGVIHPGCQRKDVIAFRREWDREGDDAQQPIHEDSAETLQEWLNEGVTFGTVYADPPWPYGNQRTRGATTGVAGKKPAHYSTMTVDDICDLPVGELVGDEAHLHLWTTNGFLFESKRVIEAWGFEYKSLLVWCKPQIGIGNYWRVNTEYLLFASKGSSGFRDSKAAQEVRMRSWIECDRGKHSSKPDVFRKMIEKVSYGPFVELFARELAPGWSAWGNQVASNIFRDAS
jgi:N6-adenosine-specific RNA methylase IME4